MINNIALIPAAGRGTRMKSVTDKYPKVMIPHLGKPIIGHQIEYLIKEGFDKVVIVVGYQKDILMQYVIKNYADKIRILFANQDELDGLATAVLEGINVLNENDLLLSNLTIILGDILPQEEMPYFSGESFVCYKEVDDWQRWCMVEELHSGRLCFYDKSINKPNTNKALMGIYMFNDIDLLKESIEHIKEKNIRINGEFQLSSAMNIYNEHVNINLKKYEKFIDFGQAEDISAARKNVARYFNDIIIEDEIVTKKSTDQNKMYDESMWYQLAKDYLGNYLPEYYGMTDEGGGYKMSRIKLPSLQEQFVFGTLSRVEVYQLMIDLMNYFKDTKKYETKRPNLIKANQDMFINKTRERIKKIKNMFDEKYYVINGEIKENPIFTFERKIVPRLEEIIADDNYAAMIHGDLFFGNMMYDPKGEDGQRLKIIDPRGKYGEENRLMGDMRYDYAKLNHSISGYYDFIINGLYYLEDNGTVINYNFYDSEKQEEAQGLFEDLLSLSHMKKKDIDMITGILFLSMIPLHKENKNNQIIQFAQAIKFLELGA